MEWQVLFAPTGEPQKAIGRRKEVVEVEKTPFIAKVTQKAS